MTFITAQDATSCLPGVKGGAQLAPEAKIFATTEQLSLVPVLYAAGANYVSIGRMFEARDLVEAVQASDAGLLEDKRSQLDERLKDRHEVLA